MGAGSGVNPCTSYQEGTGQPPHALILYVTGAHVGHIPGLPRYTCSIHSQPSAFYRACLGRSSRTVCTPSARAPCLVKALHAQARLQLYGITVHAGGPVSPTRILPTLR